MYPHRKISLKVISAPATGPVVSAPPVLKASDHTIDYACGNCGAVLLHAEDGQAHNLVIHCVECGSYNQRTGRRASKWVARKKVPSQVPGSATPAFVRAFVSPRRGGLSRNLAPGRLGCRLV